VRLNNRAILANRGHARYQVARKLRQLPNGSPQ